MIRVRCHFIKTLAVLCQFAILSCSNTDFSSGVVGRNSQPSKQSTISNDSGESKVGDQIILASEISNQILLEGLAGSCKQRFIKAGVDLINDKLLPSLNQFNPAKLEHIKLQGDGDVLMNIAAMSCDKSESSYTERGLTMVCKTPAGSTIEYPYGDGTICGEPFTHQIPVAPSDATRSLLGVDSSKSAQLIIVTYRLGSIMPDDKFVALVRKKLGSKVKISIIYPKTFDKCAAKEIIPPSNDTSWIGKSSAAKVPSTLFEKIASSTGGSTYDLCDDNLNFGHPFD